MTADEAQALIKHLKHSTPAKGYERWKYLVTAIIYYAGMRNGEIMALTPSCIEVVSGTSGRIHVRRAWNKVDGFKTPKNGKERTVTIPVQLARELLKWADSSDPEGLIFYSLTDKKKPIDEHLIMDCFRDALEAIGISKKQQKQRNLSFYSLRHGFNTALVNSGLSEVQIRAVTGHSNIAMTMHYNHQTEEALKRQEEAREKSLPFID